MKRGLNRHTGGAGDAEGVVVALVQKARKAICAYENDSQDRVDMAVRAVAWSVFSPENALMLAKMAVSETGLGNVESKVIKNSRKTFGTLRDLLRAKTVGVIEDCPAAGLVKYGKPVGVVGAVCPATNPAATPVSKAMMALKGGNAVIVAPSPSACRTSSKTVNLMRGALEKSGHPKDLIQVLPAPVTKEMTNSLIENVDLAVVTGSQNNVERAMRSGTVAIGVGAGNVPVIIDSSADLEDAAQQIAKSKTFDNATSCSSENAIVVLDSVYENALEELERVGGWRCSDSEKGRIAKILWHGGKLNRNVIAKDADVSATAFGLPEMARASRFFMVEEVAPGSSQGFADEKLSLVLAVYRASDFEEAKRIVKAILEVKGKGHSVGIHTNEPRHARELAAETDVVRVLVNQAHTFGNGGSFENCLPFTLSMGGGTWAGNTISENLNYRHFINVTHLVSTVPEDRPTEEELFGPYWKAFGR